MVIRFWSTLTTVLLLTTQSGVSPGVPPFHGRLYGVVSRLAPSDLDALRDVSAAPTAAQARLARFVDCARTFQARRVSPQGFSGESARPHQEVQERALACGAAARPPVPLGVRRTDETASASYRATRGGGEHTVAVPPPKTVAATAQRVGAALAMERTSRHGVQCGMQAVQSALAAAMIATQFAGGALQATPDLTGAWTLVGVEGSGADAPPAEALAVREVSANPNSRLPPMPPGGRALVIERRSGAGVRTDTVPIGIVGGIVGGVSGSAPGVAASRSEYSSRWRDGHLVIWHFESTAADGQTRDHEITEDWSLDAAGHLVVSTWSRHTGAESTRLVATYRRK